jgi:uncharacterized protein (DUF433 family)
MQLERVCATIAGKVLQCISEESGTMTATHIIATPGYAERDLSTELVPQTDPRACFVSIDPERLGGVPCFVWTRVPIKYLWEYLIKGKTLDEFLDDFEGVPRAEALAALQQSYDRLMEELPRL